MFGLRWCLTTFKRLHATLPHMVARYQRQKKRLSGILNTSIHFFSAIEQKCKAGKSCQSDYVYYKADKVASPK